jgi:hypothetical protein
MGMSAMMERLGSADVASRQMGTCRYEDPQEVVLMG